jgi:hypothetical protein
MASGPRGTRIFTNIKKVQVQGKEMSHTWCRHLLCKLTRRLTEMQQSFATAIDLAEATGEVGLLVACILILLVQTPVARI